MQDACPRYLRNDLWILNMRFMDIKCRMTMKMPENKEHDDNNQCTLVKFRGIPGLVSFSTILPIHIHTSIEEMAKFTWFWPIIGGFI
ncbi:MAG: hypothetical protein K8E24_001840, partial [Methanobacterium paludis]|nr:hypothetical protein [Methanobacterium paludis]